MHILVINNPSWEQPQPQDRVGPLGRRRIEWYRVPAVGWCGNNASGDL